MKLSSLSFPSGVVLSLILGWFAFPEALYRQVEQPLRFSHKTHTGEDVGMSCDACHRIDGAHRFDMLPPVSTCAECHTEVVGDSRDEKILVEDYVLKEREIPWLIYSKQPDHVSFSHAFHVNLADLSCERCHGFHGTADAPPPYAKNRITGYSRLIWGHSIARVRLQPWEGKKMDDCSGCHREHGMVESCLDCHK